MIDPNLRRWILQRLRNRIFPAAAAKESQPDASALTGETVPAPPGGPVVPPVAVQLAAITLLTGADYGGPSPFSGPPMEPGRKPCKFCGTPTGHKKQLCSPDCHRQYKAKWRAS